MSDEAAPKKKGKGKGLIIKVGAAVLIAGAGAAGGVFAAGGFHKEEGPKEDYNKPQLVLKGENAEEIGNKFAALAHEGAAEGESDHGKMKAIDLPSPKDT